MPQVPQGHDAASKDPAALKTHVFRGISGVNTAASRNAIPDDKVYNLENIIPIGPQNAQVVANIGPMLRDLSPDGIVYWAGSANVTGVTPPPGSNDDLLVLFFTNGKVALFKEGAVPGYGVLNPTLLLSGSGSRFAQWSNNVLLFIDSTGLYVFDDTVVPVFQKIVGPGVPTSGDEIAVYAGRVWIAQGRIIFASGAGDFHAASWLPQNGASFNILIDPLIKSRINRMVAANGVLYLMSDSAINVIFNVTVPIGAVPPTPVYINQNIQPLIGTDQPASVATFDQATLFANKYGVYKVYGVVAPKISEDINGTWQYLDFTQPIYAGQVVVEGILCGAFLIKRLNDPDFLDGSVLAMWFKREENDVWWFGNYGDLTLITSAIFGGVAVLYGIREGKLYRLFFDKTTGPVVKIKTKLWPLEDDLAQKEAIRVGFLAKIAVYGTSVTLDVDGLNLSSEADITTAFEQGLWMNSDFEEGLWIDDAGLGNTGGWVGFGFQLVSGRSPSMFSHNLGISLETTGYRYTLNFMALDYKLRDRWT